MFYLLVIFILPFSQPDAKLSAPSPLAKYSSQWNQAKYQKCNTAANANYLSAKEKEVIYILNCARTNPKLFAATVLKQYRDFSPYGYLANADEFPSLLDTMQNPEPLNLLYPDELCFKSAECHAKTSGVEGYVGHERRNSACLKKKYFNGECCDYGHGEPLDIIMSLLVDDGVPSLGHRFVCLSSYNKIAVSIQSHKAYGVTAVLDFKY